MKAVLLSGAKNLNQSDVNCTSRERPLCRSANFRQISAGGHGDPPLRGYESPLVCNEFGVGVGAGGRTQFAPTGLCTAVKLGKIECCCGRFVKRPYGLRECARADEGIRPYRLQKNAPNRIKIRLGALLFLFLHQAIQQIAHGIGTFGGLRGQGRFNRGGNGFCGMHKVRIALLCQAYKHISAVFPCADTLNQ